MSLEFNTGDLILFSGDEWISWMIEKITFSPYSHVAMVVVDPYPNKKGIYVLESSYEPDLKLRDDPNFLGVQLYPLELCHGVKWHRRLILKDKLDEEKVKKIIQRVLGKRYDFLDLIEAEFGVKIRKRYDRAFFCSSLIAYVYCNLGYLPTNIDWNTYLPKHFSSSWLNELYEKRGRLEKEEKI